MQEEVANAIANVRSFLIQLPPRIELGSVVTATEEDRIGVVIGIDAPEEIDQPWSYAVCWVKVGNKVAEDNDDLEESWHDGDQLAVLPLEKLPEPERLAILKERLDNIKAQASGLKQFVQGISTFGWNADFRAFCQVCGFQYDDSEGSYAA